MKAELKLVNGRVEVRSRYAPALVGRFKMIPGKRWCGLEDPPRKDVWSFPDAPDCLAMLCDCLGVLPHDLPADLRKLVGDPAGATRRRPADLSLVADHDWLTKPYDHQRQGLADLIANDRFLLGWDMGIGKTKVVVDRLRGMNPLDRWRTLILCPKSVCSVWREQLREHGAMTCEIAEGTKEEKALYLKGEDFSPITATNYETLFYNWKDVEGYEPQVLVLDEVQKCKNFTSQTCRLVRQLSEKAKYVWALSGTPAPNGLEDWLGVIECVKPRAFTACVGARGDVTKTAWEARYCLKDRLGGHGPYVITGYRNVAELHGIVQSLSSRVTKEECLDLPPKVFSAREVRLEGEQARVYRELKNDAVARLRTCKKEGTLTVRNVLTESLRLLQVVGGACPDDDGYLHWFEPSVKKEALREVLEEVGDKQVVVWCAFKHEVAALEAALLLGKEGPVVTFTGDTPPRERELALEMFRRGDARFFLATPGSGGVGVNGLQVADTEVYYSRTFNWGDYAQSQDRLHRHGQKRSVSVVNLVAEGTVDCAVAEALERKGEMNSMLLADPEEWL